MTHTTAYGDYVEIDGGVQIFCRHAGAEHDGTPVLLLHGNRDNHSHYAELESLLAEDRHTVAVDFRGHGLSTKTADGPLSPDVFARDVKAVVERYGFERIVLAGHSLGAVTSMILASTWPDRIERLVLLGAAASFKLKFKRPDIPLNERSFPAFIEEANRRAAPLFFHADHPEVQRRATASWSTMSLKVHRRLVAFQHPDLRAVVPRLTMPTLVIAGEHDKCTTVVQARWIHERLPDSELFVVPGAAHFMYMEKAELVAEEIARFLGEPQTVATNSATRPTVRSS